MRTSIGLSLLVLGLAACDETPPPAPPAPETPAEPPAEPPAPPPAPDEASDEACARVIVVAWQGAAHAADSVTRTEEEARTRAQELWQRIEHGEDFATVARAESDAASSGPRGGLLGTYTRDGWPAVHVPIRDPIFALAVGQTSEVLSADYGYVIAQRCPVEKVHTRHILIRYRGAHNAGDTERTEEQARQLADDLRRRAIAPDADFAALARDNSEDGSAARGGDIGSVGRGLLEPEYENAAFQLHPGEISPVVQTRVGFHIIQRVH